MRGEIWRELYTYIVCINFYQKVVSTNFYQKVGGSYKPYQMMFFYQKVYEHKFFTTVLQLFYIVDCEW